VNVLGINAYHGDTAAVLFVDGTLAAAVEEERYRRIKHVAGFPTQAIRACLDMAGVSGRDIDHVAVSRRPRAHLWRKALFTLRHRPSPRLLANRAANYRSIDIIPTAAADALGLGAGDRRPVMHWVEHHPAHLASAMFASPFERAAVAAIDGFGDFVSTSWGAGCGPRMAVRHRTFFPHSLGLLYLAVTQHLGFRQFGDEFKVMGLAPYGSPDFTRALRSLLRLGPGGTFELDLSYFQHWSGQSAMTWTDGAPHLDPVFSPRLESLLGPARDPAAAVEPRHEAIAASLQQVFEEAYVHVLNGVARATGERALALAGGCAMNSVANGHLRARTPFEAVYIQPAAGDNGTALGAALWVRHQVLGQPRDFEMRHGYWGPAFDDRHIERAVDARRVEMDRAGYTLRTFDTDENLCRWTASAIAAGNVVGWFQGRMEWGARALGNRSILADPRRADMREIINTRIKFREKFRPFAPSVLEEALDDFFVGAVPDPFMAEVYPVREEKRSVIPAVTHVDGSGRLQTVNRSDNALYWMLIRAFADRTGVPVVLNTSFNENEPIVLRPEEALDCFLRTRMDVLVLGRRVLVAPSAAMDGVG
jgi:carbamoyltransferase